ncbi:MAG: FAD-binding oxidoreductase [Bradymonadia bacterium]
MNQRTRSFWAWGWEDRFPDAAGQRALASHVHGLLGLEPDTPRRPPELEDARISPPRVTPPEALWSFCTASARSRIRHTYGRSWRDQLRGFNADFRSAPDCVALPENEAQIEQLFTWCSQANVALVPWGGGTSVVGGVEVTAPERFSGVVSVDLTALDRVLEVDDISRVARIQAGAFGPAIEQALGAHGLTLRHYPQSFEFSTFGGWLATRAGGHFATLYTHIDDLVQSVRMLTPSGPLETPRFPASGAGPAPERLVLGSEGAFGIITEGWVRVRERPRWRASASAHFATFEHGVAAARALAQSGLYPTNCRLLDADEAALNGVAQDGAHVLLIGFESATAPVEPFMQIAVDLASAHGGRFVRPPTFRTVGSDGDPTADAWKSVFVEAPYLQSALLSLGIMVDTFETACTWQRFPEVHAAIVGDVTEALKDVCGGGRVTCRFTHVYPDGPAPYYTFIGRVRRGSELTQWAEIKAAASEAIHARGATITHHHAVGRIHRPWYDRERPEAFARALQAVKRTLDPAGVLNPGVLVDV